MSTSINKKFNQLITISLAILFMPPLFLSVTDKASAAGQIKKAIAEKSFVYTITNPNGANSIAAYERNTETGELTFQGTYPTGGRGTGAIIDSQSPLIVDPTGAFLIAVNSASNDISVMAIQADGSLSIVGSPISSRGIDPVSLAISGDLLYVANLGNATTPASYAGFFLNVDGTLTRIKRIIELNIGDNPTQILFNQAGNLLIGLQLGNRVINCFRIKASGRLRSVGELANQSGPFAGVFNPLNDAQLIVGDVRLPGAVSYTVTKQGDIQQISAIRNAPERAACWIIANRTGEFYWVSNTGTNSLSLFSLDSNGALNLVSSHSTLAYGRLPFELAVDRDNRFLYELNVASGGTIHALRVTGDTANAGLEDIGAVAVGGGTPAGLVVVE